MLRGIIQGRSLELQHVHAVTNLKSSSPPSFFHAGEVALCCDARLQATSSDPVPTSFPTLVLALS